MPLPNEYVGVRANDLSMRINKSIISYDGQPVYVYSISPAGRVGTHNRIHLLRTDLSEIVVRDNDPLLDVTNISSHFGCMTTEHHGIVRFARIPRRQFNQGVNNLNTAIGAYKKNKSGIIGMYAINDRFATITDQLDGSLRALNDTGTRYRNRGLADASERYGVSHNMLYLFALPGFLEMWNNNYPSLAEVNRREPGLHAISKRYFVNTDNGNDPPVIYSLNGEIGTIVNDQAELLHEKAYLIEDLQRSCNLTTNRR